MIRHRFTVLLLLLAFAAGCTPPGKSGPPFVEQLIVQFESSPPANPPASIWRYRYRDEVVYYIPPSCCDMFGELFDESGMLVCAPDGGITGRGDGRCPDFFDERSEELRVWADNRQ
jgi:hypothetical protein